MEKIMEKTVFYSLRDVHLANYKECILLLGSVVLGGKNP